MQKRDDESVTAFTLRRINADKDSEIERLRKALEKIASCEPVVAGDCPSIARAALSGCNTGELDA